MRANVIQIGNSKGMNVNDGDSYPIGWFVLSYETAPSSGSPAAKTTAFDHAIIATMEMELRDTGDPVTVVRGLAYYKTDA